MSTLTKIFIVILVVFSVTFTTMAISSVAQWTNWRATAEKYQEHAKIADTNLRNQIAVSAAELATAKDAVKDHVAKIGELEGQVKGAGAEVAAMRSTLAKAESEKSSAEAMNRGLLAQLQIAEGGRTEYRKQRDEIEKRNIELERRNIDLNDRVNEQTARIAVLFEQKRQYEQQINILKGEMEKMAKASGKPLAPVVFENPDSAGMIGVSAVTPVGGAAIRGKVDEISGGSVSISVGSADGVQKDMEFVIYRGEEYVGKMKIQMVNPNKAAGKLVQSRLSPTVGDMVTDASTFGNPR